MPTLLDSGDECGSDIPRCDGSDPNCCKVCTNSLVNLGSGTYEDTQTDISIKTNGIPVSFERTYASKWSKIGNPPAPMTMSSGGGIVSSSGGGGGSGNSKSNDFGNIKSSYTSYGFIVPGALTPQQKFGWASPWFARAGAYNAGLFRVLGYFDGEGQLIYFTKAHSSEFYVPAPGAEKYVTSHGLSVVETASGIQVTDKNGIKRSFNNGIGDNWYAITSIEDTHGKRITFGYDAGQHLVSVDDATGSRVATLAYTNRLLSKLTDRDGREVNYAVDAYGHLTEVTGPQGEKTSYVYSPIAEFARLAKKTDPEGHVTTIEYKPGQLVVTKVTEPGGGTRSFAYDFKGYTFYTTDSRGITTMYKVNTDGKMTSVTKNGVVVKSVSYPDDRTQVITDEIGNSTRIRSNEKDDPISITNAEGNTTSIEYNSYWKVAKITDPLGSITTFDYNDKQDLTTVTDPLGRKTLLEYDPFGNVTKMTKGEGATQAVTIYNYDDRGNVTKVIDPLGNVTILGYDPYGHVNKVTDANGNITTITNDLLGNPVTIEDPLGNKRTFSYDKKGNVTSVTDPLNRTSSFTYDFKGRVTSSTDPLGNKTTLTYDGEGNLIEKKELAGTANEKTSTFVYDFQNRLQSATDPMGNTTGYDYSGATVDPAKITDPLGNVTRKLYNRTGKPILVTDPLNNATSIIRDAKGRPTRTTDANGNSTSYRYDSLGRIAGRTDANGGITEFGYDDKGNLISLKDPKGNTTTFDYDLAGRKTKETRPMGQATDYTYYPNGLLKTIKDAKGQTTQYTYDPANRLTEITYADATKDTFNYDAAGNMTTYAKPGVSGTITYDELGRKLSESVTMGGFTKTFSYTYDASGNKQTYTSPEGKQYTYGYNKNDQPTSISFDGKTIALDYQWIRQTKTTLPNNVTTSYSYNANSWLSAIETKQNSSTLSSTGYQFDKTGNITQKSGDASIGYGYDKTYQLTSAGTESFSYDKVGNRSDTTVNANNELTATATVIYTYDENGNTKTKTQNGQTTIFSYDARDRLTSVQLPDGRIATYTYDPFGRRIKKDVSGTVTYYVFSSEGLIGEYAQDGTVQKTYGWKPGSAWGTNPVFMAIGANTYYFHNDHLGTPQKLTDEFGNVVWSATYSAFGMATVDSASTITNNLRYPGQYFDEETGLHYNWNRYYEPETGRYVSEDPIGFGAGDKNLYRYVRNRPLNGIDPLGLYDTDDFLYDASNFLIGIGDTVSLGLTKKIRQLMDTDQYVDKCSAAYKGGEIAGALLDMYVGGVAFKGGAKLWKLFDKSKETIDLFRAVDVVEYESIMANKAFLPGGNSLEARQFALKLEEAIKYADTDISKVAIIRATIEKNAMKVLDYSKNIDPHIFKNGVVSVQPGMQSTIFHEALQSITHVF